MSQGVYVLVYECPGDKCPGDIDVYKFSCISENWQYHADFFSRF